MSYKFRSLQGAGGVEYTYGNVFRHEVYPSWSRVTFAPDAQQIPLMLEIAKGLLGRRSPDSLSAPTLL
jgi:hypothetical protein